MIIELVSWTFRVYFSPVHLTINRLFFIDIYKLSFVIVYLLLLFFSLSEPHLFTHIIPAVMYFLAVFPAGLRVVRSVYFIVVECWDLWTTTTIQMTT